MRQVFSSVPATDTAIRYMIKETNEDRFEDMHSLKQDLTFEATNKEFSSRNRLLESMQRKTPESMKHDEVYTSLGLLLYDQYVHTVKVVAFQGRIKAFSRIEKKSP